MSKPKKDNTTDKTRQADASPDAAAAARERELRALIDSVEQDKSGAARPAHESAHDYVERRMRETFKK